VGNVFFVCFTLTQRRLGVERVIEKLVGEDQLRYLCIVTFYFIPPMLLGLWLYAFLARRYAANGEYERETRCRKCGYILRGISEPRCPECGERI
jgi:hypothetical protein